jgi:glutamyl-tRNA reductase
MENVRRTEIDHARSRLGPLSSEQELAIDALTRRIVNKLLHSPISALKIAARGDEASTLLPLVERLFDLPSGRTEQSDIEPKQNTAGYRAREHELSSAQNSSVVVFTDQRCSRK